MRSRRPADTAVQNRPNTVSSTRPYLVTSHALTESIGTGMASFLLGVALTGNHQHAGDDSNQAPFHVVYPFDRSRSPLRPVNMVSCCTHARTNGPGVFRYLFLIASTAQ